MIEARHRAPALRGVTALAVRTSSLRELTGVGIGMTAGAHLRAWTEERHLRVLLAPGMTGDAFHVTVAALERIVDRVVREGDPTPRVHDVADGTGPTLLRSGGPDPVRIVVTVGATRRTRP